MDAPRVDLYFSDMRPEHVPAFFLYGEPLQPPDERTLHVETIAARSRRHDWVIEPHRHRDLHQVLLLLRGRAECRQDAATHPLRGPGFVVTPPGTVHGFRFEPGTDGVVLSLAPSLAAALAAGTAGLPAFLERAAVVPLSRADAAATDVRLLSTLLLREFGRSAAGRQAALRGLAGALLANLLRLAGPVADGEAPAGPRRELVARFRALAEAHFREHRPLRWYCAALGSTEVRLRRACLGTTGLSPVQLLHQRLLVEAERQLRYTSMPVAQVAYHLGFEDPAYFSRFFTRHAGLPPAAFRRRDGFEAANR